MPDLTINCPKCEWAPEPSDRWTCECGFSWNTFETKGKCPNCEKQWETTSCPACGNDSPHESWYVDPSIAPPPLSAHDQMLTKRKRLIEAQLIHYGIRNSRISYLPYLDFDESQFQSPYEVGCRILVLWAVAYTASFSEEKPEVKNWLMAVGLWEKVSHAEKLLFQKKQPKRVLIHLTWRLQAMLVLCWCVDLVTELPSLDADVDSIDFESIIDQLPVFDDLGDFLENLHYRAKEEIFIENIINEIATGYFRDNFLGKKTDDSTINDGVSFERHQALNWVRKFGGISEWDETLTST